ncbi:MAG TPA: 2,3-diphosphoglycerate synthetase [Gaiellaceae bacterium]|nr:2,3-diphosphoglycerate synthetase [Gaiellaceae bacterium]
MSRPRALALVDGEHYPPVVRDALAGVPYEVVAAVLVGGGEKLRGEPEYGVPLERDVEAAIERYAPELVLDLSDEPVLGPVERFALASRVLARGVPYVGADFRLDPPALEPFALPSIAVTGTGKRVGKTAVTGQLARLAARDRSVVVVAMGRGGPPEPEVVSARPTMETLLALSRAGRHAASDHLETAALVGVPTVGCRRCGGGLAGGVAFSNVAEGARVAASLGPDLVVFDGSGAALPPIATDRRVAVVGGHQDPRVAAGYLNPYRLALADLVVLTMCEPGTSWEDVRAALRGVAGAEAPVVATVLRPRPSGDVAGRTVAYFSTAPATAHPLLARHLEERHGARVVHVSGNLARRDALAEELRGVDAELFLVEVKAAAVDVVAEAAAARGVPVVAAANDVVPLPGEQDLDENLLHLAGMGS